jgi:hypothetical protein
MNNKLFAAIVLSLLLTGCANCFHERSCFHEKISDYLVYRNINDPVPSNFQICYSHGCKRSASVSLTPSEWNRVRQVFSSQPKSPSKERENISEAISILETIVGKRTGTDADIGGSFPGSFRKNQMDCVDEAVNASVYITMMEKDGLILFHELYRLARRGLLINGWPHQAPVIVEKASGKEYVVDSWFLDNGKPPFILPVEVWQSGWRP